MELRSKTIRYSKETRSKLRNKEEVLQKELQELDSKICNGHFFDQDILEKFEAAKEELKRLHELKGKEAMFRSKMKWVEQGEKPTKYFYNLEKTDYEKKLVREVKLETEDNPAQVNKEIEAFYRKMYTAEKNDNMDNHEYEHKFNDFIEDLNIPQLNDEEQSFPEKDLTINELKETLTFLPIINPQRRTVLQRNFIKLFSIFSARTFLILIMRLSTKVHYLYPRNEEQ